MIAILLVFLSAPAEPSCLDLAAVQYELSEASRVGVPDSVYEAASGECAP